MEKPRNCRVADEAILITPFTPSFSSSYPQPIHPDYLPFVQKRCKRCQKLYTEAENGECLYHTGKFEEATLQAGVNIGWTCCRFTKTASVIKDPNTASFSASAPGCHRADQHEEDSTYSYIMSNFPFQPKAHAENSIQNEEAPSAASNTKLVSPPSPSERERYFAHPIAEGDTLVGLALKYNQNISILKMINRLPSHSIAHLKELLIPLTEEQVASLGIRPPKSAPPDEKSHILRFMQRSGCKERSEALYYLGETDFNVDAAVALFLEDQDWEKNSGQNRSKIPNQPPSSQTSQELSKERACCLLIN